MAKSRMVAKTIEVDVGVWSDPDCIAPALNDRHIIVKLRADLLGPLVAKAFRSPTQRARAAGWLLTVHVKPRRK